VKTGTTRPLLLPANSPKKKNSLSLSHTLSLALSGGLGKLFVFVGDLQPLFYGLFLFPALYPSLFMMGKVK